MRMDRLSANSFLREMIKFSLARLAENRPPTCTINITVIGLRSIFTMGYFTGWYALAH